MKNVLVFAAPAAAGLLADPDAMLRGILAFVAFTLASSATYFVNDVLDVAADRLHPNKKLRPIAAGHLSLPIAVSIAAIAFAGALSIAFFAVTPAFGVLLLGYVAMTLAYSTYLKRVAVIDLLLVAAGFVLRLVGGALATDIIISDWFLSVACFSSLFVVAGKRYAEMMELKDRVDTRVVLRDYTPGFLRVTYAVAMAVAVTSYCQWAFDNADVSRSPIWYQLSAIPWTAGLLRYALLLEKGLGGAPEEVIASDRVLQSMGLCWAVLFLVGVYAR